MLNGVLHDLPEEVFIVGGGPSLKHFNFELLRDKCCVCINDAIRFVPDPAFWIFYDQDVYRRCEPSRNGAHIVTTADGLQDLTDCTRFIATGPEGSPVGREEWLRSGRLFSRYLTAQLAINFAQVHGCKIYLLGLDQCKMTAERAAQMKPSDAYLPEAREYFERIAAGGKDRDTCHFYSSSFKPGGEIHHGDGYMEQYERAGRNAFQKFDPENIINLSPVSVIPRFRKARPEEILCS
jgi:hypothetical protein